MKVTVAILPLLVALLAAGSAPEDPYQDCFRALRSAVEPPVCLDEATAALAPPVLGERWGRLDETARTRFRDGLASELARKLKEVESVELHSGDAETRRYRFRHPSGAGEAVLALDGERRLEDVIVNGRSSVRLYRERSEEILVRYSLAYLVAELDGSGVVVLEDFEDSRPGELPSDWSWRSWGEVNEKPYRIVEEEGNRFLRAEDRGENVMLYKRVRWGSRKYPYLSWKWRIRAAPRGADERVEERADSAAGLYLSYRRKLGLVPETVKFVHSGSLAPGTAFRRPGIGMPWTVVAGSGPPEEDRWQRFVFRTSSVYGKTFEGDPGGRPLGIGLLSDANNTGGLAAADYDDIVALERAESPDAVREILELR